MAAANISEASQPHRFAAPAAPAADDMGVRGEQFASQFEIDGKQPSSREVKAISQSMLTNMHAAQDKLRHVGEGFAAAR